MKSEPTRRAFSELAAVRQRMYCLLSEGFREPPTPERLRPLMRTSFRSHAAELFGEPVSQAFQQCEVLITQDPQWEQGARQEFMNLFKVPGGQYVMPYESVYRDTREIEGKKVGGLLMGQSAIDVQKWYRLAGVEISEEFKDLPDHIALELNYLAHLCAKEQEFASANDQRRLKRAWEMQRDFLAAHIVPWMSPLRDKIVEKSQHPYFRALAELTCEFTQRDLAALGGLIGRSCAMKVPAYPEE
jgi:TorA maturation chaperone TorD